MGGATSNWQKGPVLWSSSYRHSISWTDDRPPRRWYPSEYILFLLWTNVDTHNKYCCWNDYHYKWRYSEMQNSTVWTILSPYLRQNSLLCGLNVMVNSLLVVNHRSTRLQLTLRARILISSSLLSSIMIVFLHQSFVILRIMVLYLHIQIDMGFVSYRESPIDFIGGLTPIPPITATICKRIYNSFIFISIDWDSSPWSTPYWVLPIRLFIDYLFAVY